MLYTGAPKPKVFEILKLLPKTNCRECGEATCLVFATRVAEGVKGAVDCPSLYGNDKQLLTGYMSQFKLD